MKSLWVSIGICQTPKGIQITDTASLEQDNLVIGNDDAIVLRDWLIRWSEEIIAQHEIDNSSEE